MRKKTTLAFGIALLIAPLIPCVLLTSLSAAAPSAQEEAMNFTIEGKITKREGNKLTLNSEGNIIFHVVLNEKTEVKGKDGGAGTSKDLQVGTRIHVDGDLQESGEIIARRVAIQSEQK